VLAGNRGVLILRPDGWRERPRSMYTPCGQKVLNIGCKKPRYAIRSMIHVSNVNTRRSIYYAYFHSVIKYAIIFLGGNTFSSGKIFALQKKIKLRLVHSLEIHVEVYLNNRTVCLFHASTVGPRFTNLIRSWRPFVNRNVRKPKLFFP
jgi:hypothetical protein